MNKCCKNCIFWKFDCTGFVDLDDFCDVYQPSQNAIRLTPVVGDAAGSVQAEQLELPAARLNPGR